MAKVLDDPSRQVHRVPQLRAGVLVRARRPVPPGATRVHVYTWEREGISVPMMCQQCDDAACVTVCPTGACTAAPRWPRSSTGTRAKCIGCKMCTIACPFGNARVRRRLAAASSSATPARAHPECVTFCPSGALEFVDDDSTTRSRKKAYAAKFKEAFQEVS